MCDIITNICVFRDWFLKMWTLEFFSDRCFRLTGSYTIISMAHLQLPDSHTAALSEFLMAVSSGGWLNTSVHLSFRNPVAIKESGDSQIKVTGLCKSSASGAPLWSTPFQNPVLRVTTATTPLSSNGGYTRKVEGKISSWQHKVRERVPNKNFHIGNRFLCHYV